MTVAASRCRETGFTLLEVLVAFAILALSLGVLMQVFATGLRTTTVAEEYTQAVMYAESILAAVGTNDALAEGGDEGSINELFSWRSTVQPYAEEELEIDELRLEAYRVAVEVFWEAGGGRSRSVSLETLRVVTPDVISGESEASPSGANPAATPSELTGDERFN